MDKRCRKKIVHPLTPPENIWVCVYFNVFSDAQEVFSLRFSRLSYATFTNFNSIFICHRIITDKTTSQSSLCVGVGARDLIITFQDDEGKVGYMQLCDF